MRPIIDLFLTILLLYAVWFIGCMIYYYYKKRQPQKDAPKEKDPVLDQYECEDCGRVVILRVNYNNVVFYETMLFCPYCGAEYPEKEESEIERN